MTRKERWLFSFALLSGILPFIVVASTIQLMPVTVKLPVELVFPAVTMPVSKYNYLYLGLFCLAPIVLVITARILKAKKVVEHNFTSMMLCALVIGLVFLAVGAYGVIRQVAEKQIDLLKDYDFYGGAAIVVSLLMGLLANFLPDLKRNEILGLKNRYTTADESVWKRVHEVSPDVFTGTYFSLALLISGLSIWLNFRLGWLHLVLWGAASTALFVWVHFYSRSVSLKVRHPMPELPITESYRAQ